MSTPARIEREIVDMLNERAKELKCLYRIEEIIGDTGLEWPDKLKSIIREIPAGWQYKSICQVKLDLENRIYQSENFRITPWVIRSPIMVDNQETGKIEVYYSENIRQGDNSPFLPEEQKLLNSIAERIGQYLSEKKLKETIERLNQAKTALGTEDKKKWQVILELLEQIDVVLYRKITRKMLNHLCWIGSAEARSILQFVGRNKDVSVTESTTESNSPIVKMSPSSIHNMGPLVFPIAETVLSEQEVVNLVQKWSNDEKVNFLIKALEVPETSLGEISDAVYRFYHMEEKKEISPPSRINLISLLLRRVFTEQTDLISIAKKYVTIEDFYPVLQQTIYRSSCQGKLGGKSTGLFMVEQIVKRHVTAEEGDFPVKVPKTWHIASGIMNHFILLNNLEEIYEQKFKPVEEIREEYPNIIQIFKSCNFPPGIIKDLNHALDEFGESPIIVRSSSLLEDRLGAAFSGKYKSLFLANQGSKQDRLSALLDAIAEVYASMFGPDPIEYRAKKGLLDFKEEMAIMIQEVVGTRVGPYYLPAFAGVAFSNNEFRWSPRITREDGLLRIVPGLGTRAVDRLSDDYPRLIALGQPQLNVNISPQDIQRYSPQALDLINLDTNTFETIPLSQLLKNHGELFPLVEKLVSVYLEDHLVFRPKIQINFLTDDLVLTFDGLIKQTPFVTQIKRIIDVTRDRLGYPVDIEFACDGKSLYLLQCRPQSDGAVHTPSFIPEDTPEDDILFTASKFISNGVIPDITHVVYIDPDKYGELENRTTLLDVGRAVGRLNSLLPRRQFILMGPGRWGSRGDIKLGVSVTYSDISNTALLVEIARKKGSYVPDLSFGTHFFQDLVEASIRYLPLYPDEEPNLFNTPFFQRSKNLLSRLIPEFSHLEDVVFVIDVPRETRDRILRIQMNAEIDKAMAYFTPPAKSEATGAPFIPRETGSEVNYWQWREKMAERIAADLDFEKFGVQAFYLFGSTKNCTAGMGSDIDILIHFTGDETQRGMLLSWLEGWSRCLAEINYLKTGYVSDGLLDVHLVTREDIEKKTSFAVKINAVSDAARLMRERSGD